MKHLDIDVCLSGAVLLGPDVVCDGFHREKRFRIQTHVHTDHLSDFDTSKGLQTIYLSKPTRDLLEAEFNADLAIRSNVVGVAYGHPVECGSSRVTLLHSGHMLGSSQVLVERDDGFRAAYSGDFHWPLENVVQTDVLVVDSTYGSPRSVRKFSQERAENEFYSLIQRKCAEGPVYLTAHRGTLQRALRTLSDLRGCHLVASKRVARELEVYMRFGYPIPEFTVAGTPEARLALQEPRLIRIYDAKDQSPVDPSDGTSITLSAFGVVGLSPVLDHSEKCFVVAMSDHADFQGTLDYIAATGARYVVTDNTKGHGVELAQEIAARLNVEVRVSSNLHSRSWGSG